MELVERYWGQERRQNRGFILKPRFENKIAEGKRTDGVDFMIHKREPGFLTQGLTCVAIITEVTRSSGDVGTLRHMIIVVFSLFVA